ncbi:hypothetical protein [Pseudophaeobacter sp.]|uniref:hypothetical protein n=1 Tax=Pseudophaeobacter sp. TaxID=1971739 RepID=UPI0026348E25|nr:hypothetical protein [Pseudophaeobacter sp.]
MSLNAQILASASKLAEAISTTVIRSTIPGAAIEVTAPKLLVRFLIEAGSRFSWLGVRSFGNLEILTKASYASLVAVPIIAGVWPFIRNILNQYNAMVENAAETTRKSATHIENKIHSLQLASESASLQISTIEGELRSISNHLAEISQNFTFMLHETNMPPSFALAFLASLCVAIGHLFYQAFCPQAVKEHDLSSYSDLKVNQYSMNSSEVLLSEAAEYISRRVNSTTEEILEKVILGKLQASELLREIYSLAPPADENQRNITPGKSSEKSTTIKPQSPAQKPDQALIDVASRVLYSEMITDRLGAGLISLALYFSGAILILLIIGRQIASVFKATGWI